MDAYAYFMDAYAYLNATGYHDLWCVVWSYLPMPGNIYKPYIIGLS